MKMKALFVNPPVGAWSTHGNHLAPNQFHAQLIAYVREKKLAEVAAIDARGEKLDFDQTIAKIHAIYFFRRDLTFDRWFRADLVFFRNGTPR
jgi:hypothetical protein